VEEHNKVITFMLITMWACIMICTTQMATITMAIASQAGQALENSFRDQTEVWVLP
jgi:hypothetical protein